MKKIQYKQTFYSKGTYCLKNNQIKIATETPSIKLSDDKNTYSLKLKKCYDISSKNIPCMLMVYAHGHPTHREKISTENLNWSDETFALDTVFDATEFPQEKILVITVHDEDFEKWHTKVYRFFVEYHVDFKTSTKNFDYNINILQDFIGGKPIEEVIEEEPRTVGGGVLDPA